jgi:GAF domain-containing protein
LRALGEVSQAVNSTLDLETVLSTIVTKAVQLSHTKAGAIYVFDRLRGEFQLRATYGMEQELIDALTHRRIDMSRPERRDRDGGRGTPSAARLRSPANWRQVNFDLYSVEGFFATGVLFSSFS